MNMTLRHLDRRRVRAQAYGVKTLLCLLLAAVAVACGQPSFGASDAITAFEEAGLEAPNPRDVTDAECGESGCDEAIATDVVTVSRWPNATAAREYSAALRQPAYAVNQFVIAFPVETEVATNEYADVLTAAVRASEQ